MYYTVYKTTNILNGRYYVGFHETEDLNDPYLGSGIFIKKAIKKYGADNFKKELLFVFDNKKDMIDKEIEIVNENFVEKPETYNMAKGGCGLSTLSEDSKAKAIKKMKKTFGKMDLRDRSKKRIATILSKDPEAFKKMGIKSAKKQRENYKNGFVNPNQNNTDIHIYDQNGEKKFTCKRIELPSLCLKHGLPERAMFKSLSDTIYHLYQDQMPRTKKYLAYKGWYAKYDY
jgi:hypothetical protein